MPYLYRLNRTRFLQDKCRTLLINTVGQHEHHGYKISIARNSFADRKCVDIALGVDLPDIHTKGSESV